LGDRLGLWNIGQPVKQNSFPFTGNSMHIDRAAPVFPNGIPTQDSQAAPMGGHSRLLRPQCPFFNASKSKPNFFM
jgi:hypothetical protein